MKLTPDQLDEIDGIVMRGDTREMRKFLETFEPTGSLVGPMESMLLNDTELIEPPPAVPAPAKKSKFSNPFRRGDA